MRQSSISIGGDREASERWGSEVQRILEQYDDLPFAVSIGAIVFALGDPRLETAMERLELAETVARVVESNA